MASIALNITFDPTIGTVIGATEDGGGKFVGDLAEVYFWKPRFGLTPHAIWNGAPGGASPAPGDSVSNHGCLAACRISSCRRRQGFQRTFAQRHVAWGRMHTTALAVVEGRTTLDGGAVRTDGNGNLWLPNLPTSDPHSVGQLYTLSNVWMVSAG